MVGKRGQEAVEAGLMTLGILLAAVGIGLILFFYVSANADNTQFWKNFYSKDIALAANSVLGVNGDVELFYNLRNQNYNFEYEITNKGVVNVFDPPSTVPTRFHFATNTFFSQQEPESHTFSKSFPIQKKDNQIIFEEQEQKGCNIATTTDTNFLNKYLFVQAASEGAPKQLEQAVQQYLRIKHNFDFADSESTAKMSIFIGQGQEEYLQIVFIRHRLEKNQQLACILGLKLLQIPDLKIENKEVLPGYLEGKLTKEPAVLLLLPKNQDLENGFDQFPEKIAQAIIQYYS